MDCLEISEIWIKGSICFLGLIGNGIAFCTFGKMRNQNASTFLFRALAIVDSFLFIMELLDTLLRLSSSHGRLWFLVTLNIIYPVYGISHTATIYAIILVGVHRYIVVCKPLMAARLCTVGKARIHLYGILLFAININFPLFFQYVIKEAPDSHGIYIFVETNMKNSPWFKIAYNTVFRVVIVNYVIPIASLNFLTFKLLQSLHASRPRRMELIAGRRQGRMDSRLEFTVIIVLIVFVVCHSGLPITTLLETLYNIGTHESENICQDVGYMSSIIAHKLILLNSSVNIIIYLLFNRTFRRTLCLCLKSVTGRPNNQQPTIFEM